MQIQSRLYVGFHFISIQSWNFEYSDSFHRNVMMTSKRKLFNSIIDKKLVFSFIFMELTWKFVNLGEAREEAVEPSVVCPEVETDPLSVNLEYTGSTTPR